MRTTAAEIVGFLPNEPKRVIDAIMDATQDLWKEKITLGQYENISFLHGLMLSLLHMRHSKETEILLHFAAADASGETWIQSDQLLENGVQIIVSPFARLIYLLNLRPHDDVLLSALREVLTRIPVESWKDQATVFITNATALIAHSCTIDQAQFLKLLASSDNVTPDMWVERIALKKENETKKKGRKANDMTQITKPLSVLINRLKDRPTPDNAPTIAVLTEVLEKLVQHIKPEDWEPLMEMDGSFEPGLLNELIDLLHTDQSNILFRTMIQAALSNATTEAIKHISPDRQKVLMELEIPNITNLMKKHFPEKKPDVKAKKSNPLITKKTVVTRPAEETQVTATRERFLGKKPKAKKSSPAVAEEAVAVAADPAESAQATMHRTLRSPSPVEGGHYSHNPYTPFWESVNTTTENPTEEITTPRYGY